MRYLLLALLLVAFWPVSEALAARKWTDAQGKTIQGEYVRVFNGDVIIQRINKTILKVPYWNLSEEDREYVKKQLEEKGQTNLIPPEPSRNTNSGNGGLGAPGVPGAPGQPVPGGGGLGGPQPAAQGLGGLSSGPGGAGAEFPPGPGRPGIGPGFGGPGAPGAGGPGSGLPGPIGPGFSPPGGIPGGPSFPQPPGFTPPTESDSSPVGAGFGPRVPGLPPGVDPTGGNAGRSGFPGSNPAYDPPSMPEFPRMELKYKFNCRKCGHTWTGDSMIHTGPCPSCGGGISGSTNSNLFPSSNPPPSPFTSPSSSNPDTRAARQAGAITAVILMIACPLVIGLVMIVAIIAVIFFVVKAVSSPAPVAVRRNY